MDIWPQKLCTKVLVAQWRSEVSFEQHLWSILEAHPHDLPAGAGKDDGPVTNTGGHEVPQYALATGYITFN